MQRYKEPRPMKWHVFVGRRRMDVRLWLSTVGITSYSKLCEWCQGNRVEPPTRDQVKDAFPRPKQRPVAAPKPEPAPEAELAPPKPKKVSRKAPTSESDPV